MLLGFKKGKSCRFHGKLRPHLFKERHVGPTLHRNAFPDFEEVSLMASLRSLFQTATAAILHYINSTGISNQVETVATLDGHPSLNRVILLWLQSGSPTASWKCDHSCVLILIQTRFWVHIHSQNGSIDDFFFIITWSRDCKINI